LTSFSQPDIRFPPCNTSLADLPPATAWPYVDAEPEDAQWAVERFSLPVFDLTDGMVQT
jgi:hypothetical protein